MKERDVDQEERFRGRMKWAALGLGTAFVGFLLGKFCAECADYAWSLAVVGIVSGIVAALAQIVDDV
jgi:hypothetical protein